MIAAAIAFALVVGVVGVVGNADAIERGMPADNTEDRHTRV